MKVIVTEVITDTELVKVVEENFKRDLATFTYTMPNGMAQMISILEGDLMDGFQDIVNTHLSVMNHTVLDYLEKIGHRLIDEKKATRKQAEGTTTT